MNEKRKPFSQLGHCRTRVVRYERADGSVDLFSQGPGAAAWLPLACGLSAAQADARLSWYRRETILRRAHPQPLLPEGEPIA